MLKSIRSTLSILDTLSDTVILGDAIGLVCQKVLIACQCSTALMVPSQSISPVRAIHAGLAILLDVRPVLQYLCRYPCDIEVNQAAKGVIDSYDALVNLFESIEHFLNRLDIYTRIPPMPVMDEIVVKITVELLSTLALATKGLKQGRSCEFFLADMLPY